MKVAKLLALVVVLGMVGVAVAAEGDAPKKTRPPGLRGKIVSVAADSIVIMKYARAEADRKEVTVKTTADTKVTIDGVADKKVTDLAKDMYVTIMPENSSTDTPAVKIVASTKMPERPKKPADAPKPE